MVSTLSQQQRRKSVHIVNDCMPYTRCQQLCQHCFCIVNYCTLPTLNCHQKTKGRRNFCTVFKFYFLQISVHFKYGFFQLWYIFFDVWLYKFKWFKFDDVDVPNAIFHVSMLVRRNHPQHTRKEECHNQWHVDLFNKFGYVQVLIFKFLDVFKIGCV